MNDTAFARQVRSAVVRIAHLRARAALLDDPGLANEALEELGTAFEELNVALEELRVQNETLAAAEAAAAAEAERYRDLFEFAPSGYLVTDAEGTIKEANRAACQLLQTTPRFLRHKPLVVCVMPEHRVAFLNQITRLQRGEAAWNQTLRFQPRADGSEAREVDLTVIPFRDPSSRRPLLRWQLRDVTDERRAATALATLAAELEVRVGGRTAALEQALTENAALVDRLRAADREKNETLAALVHELRNPLAPIRFTADFLRRQAAPGSDADRATEMLDRQVRQLARLVDDLSELSRVEHGKAGLEPVVLDLREAVAAAVESSRARAAERNLVLTAALPVAPVRAAADPARLEQVLTNLLTNAAKYTEPGGSVHVAVAAEGGEAVVRVRDTGVGIAADFLPRVFDLFSQAGRNGAADRSQGGLGIGLHIVKRLVELHGGTVTAHSGGPGTGSEFVVRLPAAETGDAGSTMPAAPA